MPKKDLLDLRDYDKQILQNIIERAVELKNNKAHVLAPGKALALIFTKSSTRTNVSFQRAIQKLGGHAIYLGFESSQLSRGESIEDTARTLSGYVDAIMIRTYAHQDVLDLASAAKVPVINGLTDLLHPCQALADLMTIYEVKGGKYEDMKLAYIGDGNNVCNSLINAAGIFGFNITIACPEGYEPNADVIESMRALNDKISIVRDPKEAVIDADMLYTDVWVSMGDEAESKKRKDLFADYQINSDLVSLAKNDVMVLHCLPAHRGEEISADVIDGQHSYVFAEAENRMHVQQAVLEYLLKE